MKRNLALDRFRGMAVILMVAGNALSDMTDIPAFMRHTEDIGLSFADTIAPLFLFAIAASYRQSFLKHLRAFNAKAYLNYAYRYLALIGLGTIFSAGGALVSHETSWGVLQAIGMAGLLALPLLKFSPWVRLAAAGAMLAAYQLILDNFLLDAVLGSSHGGFFGSLAWGAMLILATVMLDFWQKGVRPFLAGSGALSAIAVLSLYLVPISKNRVSLSYVLVAVAICCVWYYLVCVLTKVFPKRYGFVSCWGVDPLFFYILHLFLVGLAQLPFSLTDSVRTLPVAVVCDVLILLILGFIARKRFHKKAAPEGG